MIKTECNKYRAHKWFSFIAKYSWVYFFADKRFEGPKRTFAFKKYITKIDIKYKKNKCKLEHCYM